jgi:DNA-binding NtrC family response regulator
MTKVMSKKEVQVQGVELKRINQMAASNLPILITGPTGSGKSTLAKIIHEESPRANGPFIVVNLAEMHEGTIESELFGHEKGSFTGAMQSRKGLFDLAEGGTLFLDEVSELDIKYQARLLEFLQSSQIRSVGGSSFRKLDVRIICATHRDLEACVREKKFREDLLYRIRVLSLELLGLQDPKVNFDGVVHGMLKKIAEEQGKKILSLDEKFVESLEAYSWPGNYRELHHLIEASVVQCEGEELMCEHLPLWFTRKLSGSKTSEFVGGLTQLVKEYLQANQAMDNLGGFNHSTVVNALENGYIAWASEYSRRRKLPLRTLTGLSNSTLWRMKTRGEKIEEENEL